MRSSTRRSIQRSLGRAAGLVCLCLLAGCYNFDQDLTGCFDAGLCDATAPQLLSSSPAPLSQDVGTSDSFTLVFSEPMDTLVTHAALSNQVLLANPIWEEGDTRVTFTPLSTLAESTAYVLSVEGADKGGNALLDAQIAFTTRGPVDSDPPSITGSAPADGATGVATSQKIALIFSEAIDPSTLEITVTPPTDLGAPTWSSGNTRVDFLAPPAPLAAGTHYALDVTAKDLAQNLVVGTTTFGFDTVPPPDTTAPTLVSSTPADGGTNVPLAQTLSFIFDEPMTASVASTQVSFSPSVPSYALTWYNDNTLLEVNPSALLAGSTAYTVTLNGTLQDAAGNAFTPTAISFTTTAAPDTTPPTVVSSVPASGATGVLRSTLITITFSEPMDRALTQGAFAVFSPSTSGAFSWSADSTQLIFTPSAEFPLDTTVQWQVGAGARDQAGNALTYASGSFHTVRQTSVALESLAAIDGYISGLTKGSPTVYTTGTQIYAGDSSTNTEYEAYLHVPLGISSATVRITAATLWVYQSTLIGAPYGTLYADSVELGGSLDASDFNTPTLTSCGHICFPGQGPRTYVLSTSSGNGWKSANVLGAVQSDWAQRASRGTDSQFRLRFSGLPNANSTFDYAGFYSSDNATSHPYLYVTYEYP